MLCSNVSRVTIWWMSDMIIVIVTPYCAVVQTPMHVPLLATPWRAACQASLPVTITWVCLFTSIALVIPSSHLFPWHLFSFCPQSFPASGTVPMSWLFTSDDQNTGASGSASDLSRSIQGSFPLRLTSLIFLLSKELQECSPAPQFQSINSSALCLLSGPDLTSIHDQWDHRLDYMEYFLQSDVSTFQHTV